VLSSPFGVSFVANSDVTATAKIGWMPFEQPYYLHYSSL
jgi:hypothetical protein